MILLMGKQLTSLFMMANIGYEVFFYAIQSSAGTTRYIQKSLILQTKAVTILMWTVGFGDSRII